MGQLRWAFTVDQPTKIATSGGHAVTLPYVNHVKLYLQPLDGDAPPTAIYESDSNYVWPIAWHLGFLMLAHACGPYEEDIPKVAPGRDNPYSAVSYHLVDPQTANRVVLMGACTVSGPLTPAGSACIQGGAIDWIVIPLMTLTTSDVQFGSV